MKLKKIVFALCILSSGCSSQTVEQYVANEQWQQAREVIKQQECYDTITQNKAAREECVLNRLFSTAWLYSTQAKSIEGDDEQRNRLLTLARDNYLAILKVKPAHTATINNLILILELLTDKENLVKLFPTLKQEHQIIETAEIIAQISVENGDQKSAVVYLLKAFQVKPSDGTLSRLLNAFSLKPTPRQGKMLFNIAQQRQFSSLSHAGQFYAAIVNNKNQVDKLTWEQAVLRWVEVQGQLRQLNATLVKQTFDIGNDEVFSELHQRLSSPYLGANSGHVMLNRRIMQTGQKNGGWWTKNQSRSLALAIAGWSMGHNYLLQGQASSTHNMWLGALYYAPSPNAYWGELKDKRAVTLELLTDLARLQQVYKLQIDENGNNFKAIENLLFRSKAKAYEVNDLKAISRHHTLLGKLYADLGIFERGYRGAEFQLTHAIKSAKRLAKQNNTIAPAQPLLAKLLAQGYSCQLAKQKGNCSKQTKQASQWYQTATIGYMSLDALPQAQQTLTLAKNTAVTSSVQIVEMEMLLKTRQNVSAEQNIEFNSWLKQDNSSLPYSFVKQQKFKILAEQGIKGDQKSVEQALSISKNINFNQSLTDKSRLQQLKKIDNRANN